ncbi:acyl-ACP--UDP-N-acetylglucosamine O-acyltransferase [Chitiniphilus purpureus]|uniref:Acyl-[acyl-carrier-protein]--UDP-N-acetylglucosamine O-acyltransferase n=1 Tax=Chitiniphilus purpureus TaxID=2981137 RepID=A0ABY6DLF6_9NEIS|nr:acyl-ACP--UDP-N-acetylglucosamine O-acyltransferase [Chitiniphilus sp. CD1]UXY14306.1 acyl-ACP--UDP-N-acetylglucosamine O-acyltransferase [Chitiniphilus sp. CD1]
MAFIHPTAVVDSKAELADDVVVGPYAIIGPDVRIGAGSEVGAHVVIGGVTEIGKCNRFHPGGHIGCPPQDKKYQGEPTRLLIGEGNTFFQCVTVSVGTQQDGGETVIGDDNWLMAYMHIGHDCRIGNHVVFANSVTLGGHVHVGDWVVLGGLAAIHQFCVIGAHAMAGGGSIIVQDLPAFAICEGNRAQVRGLNIEGLKRRGFDAQQIANVKRAYKLLYRDGLSYEQAREQIEALASTQPELQPYVDFFALSRRGIIR